MNRKEQLSQLLAQLIGNMEVIEAAAAADGNRSFTEEEQERFDKAKAEAARTKKQLDNIEDLERLQGQLGAPQPRLVQPTDSVAAPSAPGHTTITGGTKAAWNYEDHGFRKGFGEYLLKVREVVTHGRVDDRLMVNTAQTTWAGESVAADGGYALPPAFRQGIMSLVLAPDSFVRALNPLPTQSDLITVPSDEDAPWAATGIGAARTAEGAQITPSKPVVKQVKIVMHGIKSLVHVDEKSLRDMAFLGAFVQRKMGEKIRWKVENYVINGTGENEPLGMLNAPGRFAVTAAAGTSTGTTLSAFDIGLMEATALAGPGGFWVAHPLIKAQVRALNTGSGGFPLFQSDYRNGAAVDTLLGYPYYSSPACKGYDSEGDIFFVKPDGYFLAFESSGVQNDSTIAFAFDQNLQSFRSTLYMGGAPSLSAAVTLPDGTNKQSNIVTLAASRS